MTQFVVSTIQQQVKIYDSPLDYQVDVFRFLQMARAKQARLVVLPALSPLMLVLPLASGVKINLLKKSSRKKDRLSGLVGRLMEKAATTASQAMGGIKGELLQLLEHYPGEIYDAYIDLFSAAALKFNITIVAGSFYLREYEDADIIHLTYVFDPGGMILGRQAKIHLAPEENSFCTPGKALRVFETSVGRIGILIDEDVLYPECARMLAYQGADILINLTTCAGLPTYNQMRNAFLARVDENEVLGIQSALIGSNLLNPGAPNLVGKSAILHPFQLSDHGDGIMLEVGSLSREGFIAEPVNLEAIKDYWAKPRPKLRQSMKVTSYKPLALAYNIERTLDQAYWNLPGKLAQPGRQDPNRADRPFRKTPSASQETQESILQSPFAVDAADNET